MVKRAEGALLQSVRLDRTSPLGLSVQVAASLRDLILSAALAPGARLPATRTLARELSVARTTIVEAFDRLAAEGLLETRVGAGTYVSSALASPRPVTPVLRRKDSAPSARLAKVVASASARFRERLGHEPRPFTTAMPAFDAFPMAQWTRLCAKHWRGARRDVLGYPDPLGHPALRQAIASHLRVNRGVECDWRQVFVVAGAQQAFQIIAGSLIDPGDKVWFENPGAIGARNILVLHGADLVPVPVDEAGLDVEAAMARAPDFRLAFVTPAHQQPLGAKMSLERRFALLGAAERSAAWVIEDDWDGEFCFSGLPLPTLRSIDQTGRVIYVGTFSKSLFPSLRLGFLLAPPALEDHFRTVLEALSPGVPTALQAVVADFIAEGHFATHVRRTRKLYAERYEALQAGVQNRLSRWLELVPTTTGLHTVAFLRPGLDAAQVSAAAAARGLTVAPVDRFCIEPIGRQGLVLGFSGFSVSQISAAIDQLAEVLASLATRTAA
jgi:GntR family transcriptional regulator/MocR family aminotransferase